jgi:hypothetical protein
MSFYRLGDARFFLQANRGSFLQILSGHAEARQVITKHFANLGPDAEYTFLWATIFGTRFGPCEGMPRLR